MKRYDDLKNELKDIAEIIEKFPESIKNTVFEILLKSFLSDTVSPSNEEVKLSIPAAIEQEALAHPTTPKTAEKETGEKAKKPRKKSSGESFKIDRNLDLRAASDRPSFRDFIEEKSPISAAEFNTATIYYLIKLKGHTEATLDQAYTCYSEVKKKPPQHFKQSFRDTQNKQGYIEFNEDGNIVIPHRGVVFVEHDLPRPKTK